MSSIPAQNTRCARFFDANDELENIDPEVRHVPEGLVVRCSFYHALKKWKLMQTVAKQLALNGQKSISGRFLCARCLLLRCNVLATKSRMPESPEIPEAKDPFEKRVAVTIASSQSVSPSWETWGRNPERKQSSRPTRHPISGDIFRLRESNRSWQGCTQTFWGTLPLHHLRQRKREGPNCSDSQSDTRAKKLKSSRRLRSCSMRPNTSWQSTNGAKEQRCFFSSQWFYVQFRFWQGHTYSGLREC